jgi:predicted transcriptional regulator
VRDLPGVTVRVEKTVLARLDAEVDRRNAALAAQGASTNRGAVMAIALREFCERAEAAARAAEGGA